MLSGARSAERLVGSIFSGSLDVPKHAKENVETELQTSYPNLQLHPRLFLWSSSAFWWFSRCHRRCHRHLSRLLAAFRPALARKAGELFTLEAWLAVMTLHEASVARSSHYPQ